MKRIVSCIVFIGLAVLVGCSGDSPTADPLPTTVPDTWGLTLTASPTSAKVNSPVQLTADATLNSGAAPDGTTVVFSVNGQNLANVGTEGGTAITGFVASEAGTYVTKARVGNVDRTATVEYTDFASSDVLEIHQVLPDQGAYDGGEQVLLRGNGIEAPVEVVFDVAGTSFTAAVENVDESVPLSANGVITIRTPQINGVDRTLGLDATIIVKGGVGTASEQTFTMPEAFVFIAEHSLQIIQPFEPNTGTYEGGTAVTLRGRGIKFPARVTFTLEGVEFPAVVQSVVDSVPSSAEGTIDLLTPYIPEASRPLSDLGVITNGYCEVKVEVAVDQPTITEEILPNAFTYLPTGGTGPQVWRLGEPYIYLLVEDHGASAGGETVTVVGRNFRAQKFDVDGVTVIDTEPAIQSLTFGSGLEALIISVSGDGTQAQVQTPRYSAVPLTQDVLVNVKVVTQYPTDETPLDKYPPEGLGPFDFTLNNAFVFLADEPTPEITGIAPIAGPMDGGTVVSIFGHGFQMPVQVTFGDLEAENVNLTDDQSQADNDVITCVAPDYSQQNEVPPVAVNVNVRNVLTGKESNSAQYTYGDNLYITGNTPTEGGWGDLIIIYGSGFEDPLTVDFGDIRLEVVSVSGTELLVKFPEDIPRQCAGQTGSFVVTLLERGTDNELGVTEGGSYTYLGNYPVVTNVDPIFVSGLEDISIWGRSFSEDLEVTINGVFQDQFRVERVSDTLVEVEDIDNAETLAVIFDEQPCLDTGTLRVGRTYAPTAVDVSVINFPGECQDTLSNALVFQPPDTSCRFPIAVLTPAAATTMTLSLAGGNTVSTTINLENQADPLSGAALDWSSTLLADNPVDPNTWDHVPAFGTILPGDPVTLITITFTVEPTVTAPSTFTATLTFDHNDNDPAYPDPIGPLAVTVNVVP